MVTFAFRSDIYRFLGNKEELLLMFESRGIDETARVLGVYIRKNEASTFDYMECCFVDEETEAYLDTGYHNPYFMKDVDFNDCVYSN